MKKKALIIILLAFAVPCCWAQERLSSQLDEMQKSLDYGDRELFNNLVNVPGAIVGRALGVFSFAAIDQASFPSATLSFLLSEFFV